MKLYTLQECFEALGSKFPFTVGFYDTDRSKLITFTKSEFNKYDQRIHWYPDDVSGDIGTHFYWATRPMYDYKLQQFKNQMNDVLNSDCEANE